MKPPMVSGPFVCAVLSLAAGSVAYMQVPFASDNVLLQLVALEKTALYQAIKVTYVTMLFTTPYVALLVLSSLTYIFAVRHETLLTTPVLPPYPVPRDQDDLSLVIGEVHYPKRPDPVEQPQWLTIPRRGLYTGVMVFGAIGSGKTSGCMYPFTQQLLAFRAADQDRRLGGLILEVKGDFCHKVRRMLTDCGRAGDYIEISLTSDVRYNPLHNDLDAYALAYGIASLLNNLFGKGREPFWQQAYTNLVKFVILLHKVLYDYVTLFDVYEGAINPDLLERKIRAGEQRLDAGDLVITFDDFMGVRELEQFPFERDGESDQMKAPASPELRRLLDDRHISYHFVPATSEEQSWTEEKRHQFEAVRRWFYQDWLRIDIRLRTSIIEGISVFLSLFDDSPAVKRIFCPPKETYDPVLNKDGRYGRPLPPFDQLIEQGKVCALNFPVAANPGLARAVGTLMKQDFQRAVLTRIPRLEHADDQARDVIFVCDEYHAFATVGESDPSGDEKFFALSRQARCIPLVATHSVSSLRSTLPGESWRTLLQTFRTKIFLTLSDDFSARTASELCGKEERLTPNYSLSEQGQDAGISVFTGRAAAHKSSIGASKGYSLHRDFVFEPKIFSELKNAQAIVLAYDGVNPHPPSYVFLKPFYLDPNISYFAQLAQGAI
ncbi:MAG TPA: TraM recognition domain-containing protein [Vicinamibacterales bacterium]|nr:TraM recognition domain-containing protein [Vicinamibacterales bacterium]